MGHASASLLVVLHPAASFPQGSPARRDRARLLLAALLPVVLLGCAHAGPPAPPSAPPAVAAAPPDYVAIGPRELLAAMEGLLVHREAHGHTVARVAVEDLLPARGGGADVALGVAAGLRALALTPGSRLRYVLLVGDVPAPSEQAEGFTPVPTFYLPKLAYENHRRDEHIHPLTTSLHDHDHGTPHTGELYPSDWPYSLANRVDPASPGALLPLAVGRVPARTVAEARAFSDKIVAYETEKAEGGWRRRIEVVGGPANFGPLADGLIESTATHLLDREVPYDFDVRVLFPKLESAYAFPFRDLSARVVSDLDEGALIAAYIGHGASRSFEDVHFHQKWFEIGTTVDAARLAIPDGKPFFLSIACNTGAYDLPRGDRSLAEAMLLNPGGPIAVLASSRESHPYANALLGQGFAEAFVKGRAATIGDGVLAAKRGMEDGDLPLATMLFDTDTDDLKEEHEGLYNLLGDPATVLRYPSAATIRASATFAPGASVDAGVDAEGFTRGRVMLTLETQRSVIRAPLVSPEDLRAMSDDDAWAAMRKNYAAASDKIVAVSEGELASGKAAFHLIAPLTPGEYELKALVSGEGQAAAGHLRIRVTP